MSARLDAQAQVLAAQRRLQAAVWRLDDVYFEYADDEIDTAEGALALAARDLVEAIDALPEGERPASWKRPACAACGETIPPGKIGTFAGDDYWCEGHTPDDVKVPF